MSILLGKMRNRIYSSMKYAVKLYNSTNFKILSYMAWVMKTLKIKYGMSNKTL